MSKVYEYAVVKKVLRPSRYWYGEEKKLVRVSDGKLIREGDLVAVKGRGGDGMWLGHVEKAGIGFQDIKVQVSNRFVKTIELSDGEELYYDAEEIIGTADVPDIDKKEMLAKLKAGRQKLEDHIGDLDDGMINAMINDIDAKIKAIEKNEADKASPDPLYLVLMAPEVSFTMTGEVEPRYMAVEYLYRDLESLYLVLKPAGFTAKKGDTILISSRDDGAAAAKVVIDDIPLSKAHIVSASKAWTGCNHSKVDVSIDGYDGVRPVRYTGNAAIGTVKGMGGTGTLADAAELREKLAKINGILDAVQSNPAMATQRAMLQAAADGLKAQLEKAEGESCADVVWISLNAGED